MSDSGKEDNTFGLIPSKKKKWPKWLFIGILGVGAMGVVNNVTGDKLGLEQKVRSMLGKPAVEQKIPTPYQGTVAAASEKYFSIADSNLEFALSDYATEKLKGMDVAVYGSPLSDNPNMVVVDKIMKKGAQPKEAPVYTRLLSVDYSDSTIADKFGYKKLRNLKFDNKKSWEGEEFEKARVIGKINLTDKYIDVFENGNVVGKVLLTNISDYALFKLRQQGEAETYTFYIDKKDSVPWNMRQKTKELFYAKVVGVEKFVKE